MRQKPRIVQHNIIARTRIFRVEEVELEFANGVRTRYERIRGGTHGAVLVIPLLDEDTVLLIREYAVGTDRYELAFPKGRVEAGEDPVEAANREIKEEIGYGARHLEHMISLTLAPGYIGSQTHVILARDLYEQRLEGDEPEPIEVVPWNIERVDELLVRDDFSEARTIAALYMVRDRLRREREQADE